MKLTCKCCTTLLGDLFATIDDNHYCLTCVTLNKLGIIKLDGTLLVAKKDPLRHDYSGMGF